MRTGLQQGVGHAAIIAMGVLHNTIAIHAREEKEACPWCEGRHPSYSYTDPSADFGDVPGRRYCVCGYAESPVNEGERESWRSVGNRP